MRFRGQIGADQLQLISDVVQAMYRQGIPLLKAHSYALTCHS